MKKTFLALALSTACFFTQGLYAQAGNPDLVTDPSMDSLLEALKEQALVLRVQVRQIDPSGRIVWFNDMSRITVHGRVVGFKLEGSNIYIDMQFTPYRRNADILLLVQSQIWIKGPDQQRLQYNTHLSSVLGDVVLYYPLGRRKADGSGPAHEVEMEISIVPYSSVSAGETGN